MDRAKSAPPDGAAGGGQPATAGASPGDATAGRTEFRGADHGGGGGSSARCSHRRPRPRSAVARVETASHHGKASLFGASKKEQSRRVVGDALETIPAIFHVQRFRTLPDLRREIATGGCVVSGWSEQDGRFQDDQDCLAKTHQ